MFSGNIEELTLANNSYRKVIYTSPNKMTQLVLMSLKPLEEIGMEVHPHTNQFIRIEKGSGTAIINDQTVQLADNTAIIIPAGANHNVINTSKTEHMKLYTIYTPAEHEDKLEQITKPQIGGAYRNKYLKYKSKYKNLKSKLTNI